MTSQIKGYPFEVVVTQAPPSAILAATRARPLMAVVLLGLTLRHGHAQGDALPLVEGASRLVHRAGKAVHLTPIEYKLLEPEKEAG